MLLLPKGGKAQGETVTMLRRPLRLTWLLCDPGPHKGLMEADPRGPGPLLGLHPVFSGVGGSRSDCILPQGDVHKEWISRSPTRSKQSVGASDSHLEEELGSITGKSNNPFTWDCTLHRALSLGPPAQANTCPLGKGSLL